MLGAPQGEREVGRVLLGGKANVRRRMGAGPRGRLGAHRVAVAHKDVGRGAGGEKGLCPAVHGDDVVRLGGEARHEPGRARLGRAVHDKGAQGRLAAGLLGPCRGHRALVVFYQRERELRVAVRIDVAVGAHILLAAAVVVVHEAHDGEARLVRGLHAKGRVLKDPGSCLGRAQAAQRLLVDVGELLVAATHVLGRDDVGEVALQAVRLERPADLAHGRRRGDDHGHARRRELAQERLGARHGLDLEVLLAHVGAELLVERVGGVCEPVLLVRDPAAVLERQRLHALEEARCGLLPAGAEDPRRAVRPHPHRVQKRPVAVEDGAVDPHACPPNSPRLARPVCLACVLLCPGGLGRRFSGTVTSAKN